MDYEEITKCFIPLYESKAPTEGKYASKKQSFYKDIKKWQKAKPINSFDIRPLQFTFEITNRCNCNCKDCGMAANRIETERTMLEDKELIKMVDDLEAMGIPAIAITGGEPFLAFTRMCKVLNHAHGKIDVLKIISNGFWGINPEYYFKKLEENGLFDNQFFIPSIQISIGEQTVPLEYICNIINYVSTHYSIKELNVGIIHTREQGLKTTKLEELYGIYLNKFGEFPKQRIFLTDSYYVNSNPLATEKLNVATDSVYNMMAKCDNTFAQEIGTFVSPKIFMKCNGDCYPCEVFNLHQNMFIGNFFKDGLEKVMQNYNTNKYIKFIKDFGTVGFRDVIPKKILEKEQCETVCYGCEFCIKFSEKNKLIR